MREAFGIKTIFYCGYGEAIPKNRRTDMWYVIQTITGKEEELSRAVSPVSGRIRHPIIFYPGYREAIPKNRRADMWYVIQIITGKEEELARAAAPISPHRYVKTVLQ